MVGSRHREDCVELTGNVPFRAIIHLAGINILRRASERSIRPIAVAEENGIQSIAFPLIGDGSGSFNQEKAKQIMLDELQKLESPMEVTVVIFKNP